MIWDDDTTVDVHSNIEKLQEDIHNMIKGEPGWIAMGVFGDREHVPFTYTIGLMENWDHPELIIYGVPYELGHQLLIQAVEIIKNGTRLEPGNRYDYIMADYPMEIREHPSGAPLNWATNYYDKEPEVLQMVWPDANGTFPEENGFDPEYEGHQTPQTEGWDQ